MKSKNWIDSHNEMLKKDPKYVQKRLDKAWEYRKSQPDWPAFVEAMKNLAKM